MGPKHHRPDALAGAAGAGGRMGELTSANFTAPRASAASHRAALNIARRFGLRVTTACVVAELAGIGAQAAEGVHG